MRGVTGGRTPSFEVDGRLAAGAGRAAEAKLFEGGQIEARRYLGGSLSCLVTLTMSLMVSDSGRSVHTISE
jgi:hypothetical protein